MKEKTKLMVLIILECRLSLKTSSKVFNIPEDELLKRFEQDNYAYEYKDALTYLFNYETAIESEEKSKRTLLQAKYYIYKINKILSNPNLEERKKDYRDFINKLTDNEIKILLSKETKSLPKVWTKEQKRALLKYKLKNALSNRTLGKRIQLCEHTIGDWIYALDESEFKEKLITLNEYWKDIFSKDLRKRSRIR